MTVAAIARRIGFVVLGYFAGIATGSAAFPCILAIVSLVVPESSLWDWLGLGPIAMIVAPIVFFFIMWITVIVTFVQAVVANAVTEIFALRSLPVHLAIAVALALSAAILIMPDWFSDMDTDKLLISVAALGGALVGGLVYWAITGRCAGLQKTSAA